MPDSTINDRISVCMVAYNALPVFDTTADDVFGGIETEFVLLARELARNERFEVRLVVRYVRKSNVSCLDGVQVVTRVEPFFRIRRAVSQCVDLTRKWPWLRIHRWQPSLLWKIPVLALTWAFRSRDPDPFEPDPFFVSRDVDVFLCFGVNSVVASVASSCRASDAGLILFLASDADIDARFGPDSDFVNVYGEKGDVCYHALASPDRVVAQTTRQQGLLRERFNLDSDLINKLFDLPDWDLRLAATPEFEYPNKLKSYVLWLGRADEFHKRPLLLLKLARRCSEIPFLMILNRSNPEIERQVLSQCPPNVRIVERVPFDQLSSVYRRARLYVSTGASEFEGFPNVFLQAAASSIPILSLEVDPGFVEAAGVGFVAHGDLDRLAETTRMLWHDELAAKRYGVRGRRYVEENHQSQVVATRIAGLIRDVVAGKDSRSRPSAT